MSRPPANFSLLFANAFYELWKREASPRVYAHMPLGEGISAAGRTQCTALRKLLDGAPAGAQLAVASVPATYGYELEAASSRSPGWAPDTEFPGAYRTPVPGKAQGTIDVAGAGRYELWIQGNLPRTVMVTLEGRDIGSASGSDSPGGWLSGGTAELTRGQHVLGVLRGGGGLGPGNGSTQASIGAVAVVSTQHTEQVTDLPIRDWRTLCGRQADWVELIS
jgi:hypothetical protein